MPISSARAAGRSPELPMAVASDGVSDANGYPSRCQPRWISRNASELEQVRDALVLRVAGAAVLKSQPYTVWRSSRARARAPRSRLGVRMPRADTPTSHSSSGCTRARYPRSISVRTRRARTCRRARRPHRSARGARRAAARRGCAAKASTPGVGVTERRIVASRGGVGRMPPRAGRGPPRGLALVLPVEAPDELAALAVGEAR